MEKQADLRAALTNHLKELRLPTMLDCFENEALKARQETLTHERYLLELCNREMEARRHSRIERLLRDSRLPLEKSLGAFDLKRLPQKVQHQTAALLEGHFITQKENVLAFGNPGSGKTHLLCAIGQELVRKGHRVLFTTCGLLVQELLIAKRDLKLARVLKRLNGYEALILDDIGYVQQSRDEMEVLFALLAERYERGSLMVSSNLPFAKWDGIFKDAMTTAAAIDRLVHHSVILEINLPSYRMEHAGKSRKSKAD